MPLIIILDDLSPFDTLTLNCFYSIVPSDRLELGVAVVVVYLQNMELSNYRQLELSATCLR